MENKIHIALASDSRGAQAMATTIVSALHNKNTGNFYTFHLFLAGEISGDLQQKLRACAKGFEESCQINLIDLKDKFSDIKLSNHVTYATYFRLLIPSSLPNLAKIIYIDIDTLVRQDLEGLWNFDVGENYIAAVPDYYGIIEERKKYEQAHLPDMDFYINAGVLLMNLERMRQDSIEQKCLAKVGDKNLYDDQVILNFICYPKIAFLPCKWNVLPGNVVGYRGHIRRYDILYSPGELNDAWANPAIFHWGGPGKPWKYYDVPLAHEWFRYYLKNPMSGAPLQRKPYNTVKGKFKNLLKNIAGFLRVK
jgi:lipopolysaccharide biosynthesis glycosyltransferase